MKTLQELFDRHKCDKGTARHRYDRVYEPALEHLRDTEFNLLEVGVLRGESLKTWVDFFPKVNLFAIDIFGRVPAHKVPILKHERVHWCNCNSIKGPNAAFKEMIGDGKFEVIIDDGLHTHDSQRCTFENFISFLADGGVFFIEDVWAFNHMSAAQKKHRWMVRNPKDYSDRQYAQLMQALKPYNTTFHDIRKGYQPDTFIIEIRK